jgi:oligosaccharide repeat unit polymerase
MSPEYVNLRVVGAAGLLQYIFSIYASIKNGQKLISPYIVFLTVMYVFQAGQSLMYPFDIISGRDLIGFYGITISEIFHAQLITFAFLAFFQIGSLLCMPSSANSIALNLNSAKQNKRLRTIGYFLAIISVYPYYNELIGNAILSMMRGYGALYEGEAKVGLANLDSMIADYFIPALICLYISYRNEKMPRMIIVAILMFNCAVILVTGGRTEAVIIMALLLILHNYLVNTFSKKKLLIIGGIGVLVLILLASISQMRSNKSRNFEDTFELSDNSKNNGVVDAIGEMGGSMFCLIWTDEVISRSGAYRYGSSYAYAFTSVIPNLGFWKIHPAKEYANLGHWLGEAKHLSFGTGYSMVAEAYVNFWLFGILAMALVGFFATKIFGRLGSAIKSQNIAFVALILVFFWFSLKIPRNSFLGVVRALFYFALPIYWYTRGYILKRRI